MYLHVYRLFSAMITLDLRLFITKFYVYQRAIEFGVWKSQFPPIFLVSWIHQFRTTFGGTIHHESGDNWVCLGWSRYSRFLENFVDFVNYWPSLSPTIKLTSISHSGIHFFHYFCVFLILICFRVERVLGFRMCVYKNS